MQPAGRHQSGRFARNLAFITAEIVEDAFGRPILLVPQSLHHHARPK